MKSKKKCIIIVLLAVILLAGAVYGAYRYRQWKEEADRPSEPPVETTLAESESTKEKETDAETTEAGSTEETTEENTEVSSEEASSENASVPEDEDHPKAPELTYLSGLEIPPYDGKAYIMLNDGLPFFDTSELLPESYEIYYDLDDLGRCTLADSVVGQDLMPQKKRDNISSVHPTGWHKSIYHGLVDGDSLYNRCHLIAFGLTAESANKYNLVTGTRYFNTKGVNDFENLTIDYIRETGNHVRYRVTPVFTGDNLVCDGEIIEAWSIEDEGEAICFCIYAYNVQPGIVIDYATGDNWLEGGDSEEGTARASKESKEKTTDYLLEEDYIGTFVLNIKKKKFHLETCPGAADMNENNKQLYTGSYNELIRQGYEPHSSCVLQNPAE